MKPAHLIGHLHLLWHAALEQQENGDLSKWSDEMIATSSGSPCDAPQWVRLLQEHGWLDNRLLHDWPDYAGAYLRGKYAKDHRDKLVAIWHLHGRVYGQSNQHPTEDQPKPNPTLPDLTLPNQTQIKSNGREANEGYLVREIIQYLNSKTDSRFTPSEANAKYIRGRLRDGHKFEDFKHVIDVKVAEWTGTDSEKYLRPETLFRPGKFEAYLNQKLRTVAPKPGEAGYTPTDVDRIIFGYREVLGIPEEARKEWNETCYEKCKPAAEKLFKVFGNWKDAFDCIAHHVPEWRKAKISFSLDTVVTRAVEFKHGRATR